MIKENLHRICIAPSQCLILERIFLCRRSFKISCTNNNSLIQCPFQVTEKNLDGAKNKKKKKNQLAITVPDVRFALFYSLTHGTAKRKIIKIK